MIAQKERSSSVESALTTIVISHDISGVAIVLSATALLGQQEAPSRRHHRKKRACRKEALSSRTKNRGRGTTVTNQSHSQRSDFILQREQCT